MRARIGATTRKTGLKKPIAHASIAGGWGGQKGGGGWHHRKKK